jgi:hypothetical protein
MTDDEGYFGSTLILTGPVVCVDGTKFEDYTWEEHLYYYGLLPCIRVHDKESTRDDAPRL